MSRTIETVTISSVEDRQLKLTNAQCARVISVGSNWNRIRIGVRLQVEDSGSDITGNPRFWIGMLASPNAGLTNGPLSVSTSHFVGGRSVDATWTRVAGARYAATSGSSFGAVVRIGATTTVGSSFGGGTVFYPLTTATKRWIYILEILKGSPNYTLEFAAPGNNTTTPDHSLATLVNSMELGNMAGILSYLNLGGTTHYATRPAVTNLAVNEGTNGALNAVCVAWDRTNPGMRFSDIMWSMLA